MSDNFFQTTIGEQLTLQRGFDITKKQQIEGPIPVVSSGGISSYHNEFKVKGPGVVLGRKGTLGTVFYLNEQFWPHDTSLWVKDFKGNEPRYVYYFFLSISAIIKKMDVGAANPALNRNHVHPMSIFWPNLANQKAIAHILGKLDDKIELNRQMNQTLEAMAQALFKSWFVDFDPVLDNAIESCTEIPEALKAKAEKRQLVPESKKLRQTNSDLAKLFPSAFVFNETLAKWIPEGWEVKSFGDVSNCFDRKRIPLSKRQREEKQPGPYPYYGATSINDYINEYIFDDTYLLLGEDGSVMKEDGTPFTQYVWGKIWVNNHAHVLQGTNSVSTEHLMTFIRNENINAYVTGAVQLKINQGNMNRIPFLFSSKRLNHEFSITLDYTYARFKLNFEQIEILTKLRDTLLPQLISGKVRVPEWVVQKINY
jgi:type I restriction enzyme S subunit